MRKLLLASFVLAVIAIGVVMYGRATGTKADDPPPDRTRDAARAAARREAAAVVKATGIIKPMIGAEVRVGSRISGVVTRLFVRIGDRVTKGQLLAELDARELTARREEAAAAVELARANVAYALADLRRKRELSAGQLIAPSDLDIAERAYAVAEQQRTQSEATLAYATTQLGYTRIDAPISGVVSSVSTQEGETVAASLAAPTFVTLLDLARLEVWAYVDETDIGRIRRGQAARFTVDTYGDEEFTGRVATVYPQAAIRDNVVNYVTVVRFTPPRDRILRPEMTTTVRIAIGDNSGAPDAATRTPPASTTQASSTQPASKGTRP
jgi:HlyD family secretion protein